MHFFILTVFSTNASGVEFAIGNVKISLTKDDNFLMYNLHTHTVRNVCVWYTNGEETSNTTFMCNFGLSL